MEGKEAEVSALRVKLVPMDVTQAIILGIVQGLTEFLPVSSSGHLVLANYYIFGNHESLPLIVDVATNTGTLLAVLVALRKDVWLAMKGFFDGIRSAEGRQQEGWKLALLVIVGSVPTALIGLALKNVFEILNQPIYVSIALIVTGVLLWFTPKSGEKKDAKQLTFLDALIGGISQGFAVIPGISRAGITISTMLWRGASSDLAPRFSFLMYLVVSLGVAVLELPDSDFSEIPLRALLACVVVSFITGYVALIWLFALLRRGQFRWFSPYLWAVAGFTLLHLWLS